MREPRHPPSLRAEEIGAFSRSSALVGMEGAPETLADQEAGPDYAFSQRAPYPLNKEYTLNYEDLDIMM